MSETKEAEWQLLLSSVSEKVDLEATARSSGALLRRRSIRRAENLLRLALAYGPGGQSLRDTASWSKRQGIADLSAVALMYRLRDSAPWLEGIAGALLAHGVSQADAGAGRRIRLVDGSVLSSPGKGQDWRLHAVYDLEAQRFDSLELTPKTTAESLERITACSGDLILADRVFARPDGLAHLLDSGADFVVRMGQRSLRLEDEKGERFDLDAALDESSAQGVYDRPVKILNGSRKTWLPRPARLVILPKPPEAAEVSRKQALRSSQRCGSVSDPLSIKAAGFLMLITSLGTDEAEPDQLGSLYRSRWQIELAFKRLKSLIHIDRLPAKEPGLAKAWLLSHLIAAILIDDMSPLLRDSSPSAAP